MSAPLALMKLFRCERRFNGTAPSNGGDVVDLGMREDICERPASRSRDAAVQ